MERSEIMRRVLSSGNRSTEKRLIGLFRRHKINGWRRGAPLPGKPDFIFPRLKLAVFVDGCFWHGCPLHGTQPRNNAVFWLEKITRNKTRDRQVGRLLRTKGWVTLRIWEHDLSRKNEAKTVRRILKALSQI